MRDVAIMITRHAISTCDLHANSIAANDRRDGHPANGLMGCMNYCESTAAEIACTASLRNGFAHQSDLQCWNSRLEITRN